MGIFPSALVSLFAWPVQCQVDALPRPAAYTGIWSPRLAGHGISVTRGTSGQRGGAPEGWNLEGQPLPFFPGQRGPERSAVLAAWGSPVGARFAALRTRFTHWCHSYHPQPRRGDKSLS